MLRRVDQFHSGTASGDAVTQQMFSLRAVLRGLGYESDIWAQHIAPALADDLLDVNDYVGAPDQLLLVHHSIGHTAFDRLLACPTPIITIFHSITPAHFFTDASTRYFVRLGVQQLRRLAKRSIAGVAVSNHNRLEMLNAGFSEVDVIPVRTDFSAARAARHDAPPTSDWLFVGRIAPNKHQRDVVRAFAAYSRTFDDRASLTLVGDRSMSDYVDDVLAEAKRLQVGHKVRLTGKVSDAQLWEAYGQSSVFVCLSEHEGFGVPLLEAMAAGLPVIARRKAAIPETMGDAGIMVDDADYWKISAIARLLATDEDLRRRVVAVQDRRLRRIEEFDVAGALTRIIGRAGPAVRPISLQVQGPFETTYSLAAMNRGIALGLAEFDEFDVSIYATEGPGDYTPQAAHLADHPAATALYDKRLDEPYPDVVIRQMYPPRVDDSPGAQTFLHFAWEESGLPAGYVESFNRHLDGIGATSHFVADLLRSNGVAVPIAVVGNGVTPPEHGSIHDIDELLDARTFRFLHVSSAFPRKAVDVLLDAYFAAFSGDDDVSLVLKTHPNPHNQVAMHLEGLRQEASNPPHVCWIDRDLDPPQLGALYWAADCLVHVARGEGFGLPVAEAMLAEVPVIATESSGLADFVDASTATTIPSRLQPADTHLSQPNSLWYEPDAAALVVAMKEAFAGVDEERRRERVRTAKERIEEGFSWSACARRWRDFVLRERSRRPGIKVAMVTTWNSRCGIGEYARTLVDSFIGRVDVEPYADEGVTVLDPVLEESTFRTWRQNLEDAPTQLHAALQLSTADVVHIQYNFGFFSASDLQRLIEAESERRPVVVTLHRTADLEIPDRTLTLRDAVRGLQRAAQVIVHQREDVLLLRDLGVERNVRLIPIGCNLPRGLDMLEMRSKHHVDEAAMVVGTFGFLLPHKGTLELIRSIGHLRSAGVDARLIAVTSLHPDLTSSAYLTRCADEVRRLGLDPFVSLKTDYLPELTAHELLAACDVIALPYGETRESSSAALRSVLPVGRPIVVSDVPIFDDARDVLVHVPSPVDPEELAARLRELLEDGPRRAELGMRVEDFCRQNSWPNTGRRTLDVYDDALTGRAMDIDPSHLRA